VGNAMLQHLEGGPWNFLALQRFNSWQDYATSQTSAGSGSGQDDWSELRHHIATHHDTVADRIALK
jgi:hypothetical protein